MVTSSITSQTAFDSYYGLRSEPVINKDDNKFLMILLASGMILITVGTVYLAIKNNNISKRLKKLELPNDV
jgi:hypothetical protein